MATRTQEQIEVKGELMRELVEGCGVCSGTSLFIECVCEGGLEKGRTVLYVPADLDPILNWCFFHDREQFWWEEKGDTPGCIHLDRDRGDCDIGLGAVVRVEKTNEDRRVA